MSDERRTMNPEELEQLRELFKTAWTVSENGIAKIAGRDFLAGLLADAEGEIVVNIALKARAARVCVNWPEFSPQLETVCELQTYSDPRRAS